MVRKTVAALLMAGALSVSVVQAQAYPTQPITIVVAFAAGGSTDIVTRVVAEKMSEMLGQPIVIENRGGADGNVAAEYMKGVEPDGYTLLASTNSLAINLNLYTQSYHPVDDFDPVVRFGEGPNVIVVHPSVPAENLEEFVKVSQNDPLFFAATASGTWLATELFKQSTGLQAERIPYSGAGTAVPALLGGEVQMMLTGVINALPHINSGALRPIIVTSQERSNLLPDVPSVGEFGLTEYNDAVWYGLLAPAGTPKEIVTLLNETAREAMRDPAVRERLEGLSVIIADETPEEFAQRIAVDIARWADLIESSGISLN